MTASWFDEGVSHMGGLTSDDMQEVKQDDDGFVCFEDEEFADEELDENFDEDFDDNELDEHFDDGEDEEDLDNLGGEGSIPKVAG